ncbi:secondary thiamine-phosphate synthase enzyme YjbQ [Altericroceibacterium endophyticum]|uniref:YjbQ family protein n=1 Tax=Altericroceibacterium endophyticum TaxID=1808508 RepID=A0A6I4T5Y4_9SPHN|nr:secondary thiamine-phosphate synthase enzyme YjbQ [Altericroceibacterium endophyticum]MXO66604.1 YjbQ family protein [Altericroceibacterium endophyticum]
MRQIHTTLTIATQGQSLNECTHEIADWLGDSGISDGLLTIFCQHTSASLLINENAAREVPGDILRWLDRTVPEGSHYAHDDEGPDDMPAHIKAMLTGNSLTIPVAAGQMMLGTWQGVFLAEHRARPHRRRIILHLLGE